MWPVKFLFLYGVRVDKRSTEFTLKNLTIILCSPEVIEEGNLFCCIPSVCLDRQSNALDQRKMYTHGRDEKRRIQQNEIAQNI